jgi:rhamnosyltransferase
MVNGEGIDISIIIPTRNAGPDFRETLSAIFRQEGDAPGEVIVIDSGSTDGTPDVCRQFPVKLVEIPPGEFGHGRTRNHGASLASGEFLVFLVQDALPLGTDWLPNLLEPLRRDDRIAAAYSRNVPRPEACRRQAREIERYFPAEGRLQSTPADHTFSNVSSAIRKAVLDLIPFPAAEFGEDQLWARQALAAGHLIQYQPSSVVAHSHDYGLKTAFQRGRQEGTLAKTMGEGPRPSSAPVIILEAVYETARWAIRGDLQSCRYSLSMAAWHFGFRNGYLRR